MFNEHCLGISKATRDYFHKCLDNWDFFFSGHVHTIIVYNTRWMFHDHSNFCFSFSVHSQRTSGSFLFYDWRNWGVKKPPRYSRATRGRESGTSFLHQVLFKNLLCSWHACQLLSRLFAMWVGTSPACIRSSFLYRWLTCLIPVPSKSLGSQRSSVMVQDGPRPLEEEESCQHLMFNYHPSDLNLYWAGCCWLSPHNPKYPGLPHSHECAPEPTVNWT